MNKSKNLKKFGTFTIENCLHKNIKEFRETGVLSLKTIQEHLNKDYLLEADIDFSKEEDFNYIDKIIKKSKYNLADFELTKEGLKRKLYQPFVTEFKTSGKIIVENDIRDYFNNSDDFDINATKGIIQTMDFYTKQGMLHGFVGNSCPAFFLSKEEGKIIIGVNYDEETDEPILPNSSYEKLTSVCTDLWWYCIVDANEFMKNNPNENINNFNVVEIPAGTWVLEHKYGITTNSHFEDLPYATLTLKK